MSLLTPSETVAPAQRTPRGFLRPVPAPAPSPSTAASERELPEVLDELAGEGWTVLHGPAWPGRWTAAPAHVLVGLGGVVVVDVDARPWRLTPDGGLRLGRRDGARECRASARRAADVASLLHHEHHTAVRAVLCLTSQPLPAAPVAAGVTVTGPRGLAAAVRQLPVVLDAVDVQQLSAHLQWQLLAREQRVDRGAALLGLVPAQRPASDDASRPAASVPDDAPDGAATPSVSSPVAEPAVFATRREALAAERERSGRTR